MRPVRIATTSFLIDDQPHTLELNLQRALAYIDEAARREAGILCLPETVLTNCVGDDDAYAAENFPGHHTAIFQEQAKARRLNLIAPYFVRDNGRLYNQATIIDRNGDIAGFYRKVQPTAAESRHVTPGDALPVFDLDFGRVAVMICLDIYFGEIVRIYAAKGAEIVFWPTVTHGPTQHALLAQLTARAVDHSVVMVEANLAGHPPYAPYAGRYRPGTGRIVDHNGDVLAQTGRRHGIACADVDLDDVRLTSSCVLIREPDHIREDLQRLARLALYGREYLELAKSQRPFY